MKEIIIVAGPNGSGKSTLAKQIDENTNFINADVYAKLFLTNIADKEEREKRAAIAVAKKIKDCITKNISFVFETVFSTDQIPEFLKSAKDKGYNITLHFIATNDPEINATRVAKRVSEGGHDIPRHRIFERYDKSLAILPKLLHFACKAILYDNSQEKLRAFLVKEDNQIKIIDELPKWAEAVLPR